MADENKALAAETDNLPKTNPAYVDLAEISTRERGINILSMTFHGTNCPLWYLVIPFPIGVLLGALIQGVAGILFATIGTLCACIYEFCILPGLSLKYINPIGFPCTHCDKHLSSVGRWVCGFCNSIHKSWGPWKSFERPCPNCERLPKAYRCYHCGKTVCLDATCDERNPAYSADVRYPSAEEIAATMPPSAVALNPIEQSKAAAESTISKMIAEKVAFSMIIEKVCELRDADIKKINDSELDPDTKRTRIEYEKQWAKTQLESIKMQAIRGRK